MLVGAGEVVDKAALADEGAHPIVVVLPCAIEVGVEQPIGGIGMLAPGREHALQEASDPGAIGVLHAPPSPPSSGVPRRPCAAAPSRPIASVRQRCRGLMVSMSSEAVNGDALRLPPATSMLPTGRLAELMVIMDAAFAMDEPTFRPDIETVSGLPDSWPCSALEAALMLGVSERTIRRAIARGELVA